MLVIAAAMSITGSNVHRRCTLEALLCFLSCIRSLFAFFKGWQALPVLSATTFCQVNRSPYMVAT
jgi:hypothetical protein